MRRTSVLMATVLMISVHISGQAFGTETPAGPGPAPAMPMACQGPQRQAPVGPMPVSIMLLLRYQEIDVLSELTGLTQENVKQLLIASPPPAILEAYGIPFETYASAMDKQTLKLVRQAQIAGMITKKQEDEIRKRMALKTARPAPMGDAFQR